MRPKVETLSKDPRFREWVEFAEECRTNVLEKVFMVQNPDRLTVRIGASAFHGSVEEPIKWEETLSAEESDLLTKHVPALKDALQRRGLTGFERTEARDVVSLYVRPHVVLVVLSENASMQVLQMYNRVAKDGRDPRGDVVMRITDRIYSKSERR